MKLMICLLGLPLALSGCVTPEERAQLSAEARVADDSECRSYGAEIGTPVYVECRMVKDQLRAQEEAAADRENDRQIHCGLARMASSFGTAEQQHDKKMALAASGC
jgi:hypothetical protein